MEEQPHRPRIHTPFKPKSLTRRAQHLREIRQHTAYPQLRKAATWLYWVAMALAALMVLNFIIGLFSHFSIIRILSGFAFGLPAAAYLFFTAIIGRGLVNALCDIADSTLVAHSREFPATEHTSHEKPD